MKIHQIIFSISFFFLHSCLSNDVQVLKDGEKIDILINGKPFTSYLFRADLTKPVLFPVFSPSGIKVNRSYPFEQVEGESTDHPHHTGIFFTYDRVNGSGFWNNTTYPPQIKHVEIKRIEQGDEGVIETVSHWIDARQKPLLRENRIMKFYPAENANFIDFDLTLTAIDTTVTFGDTKEGMFAIRVASWLQENESTRYFSSNGDETEKNIWGTRAKWVTLEGKKDDKTVGIAIFHHPQSANYPTFWHARAYGLFSANPLGQLDFQKGRGVEKPEALNLTLEPGKSARFRFLFVVYEGQLTKEKLENIYLKFAEKE